MRSVERSELTAFTSRCDDDKNFVLIVEITMSTIHDRIMSDNDVALHLAANGINHRK